MQGPEWPYKLASMAGFRALSYSSRIFCSSWLWTYVFQLRFSALNLRLHIGYANFLSFMKLYEVIDYAIICLFSSDSSPLLDISPLCPQKICVNERFGQYSFTAVQSELMNGAQQHSWNEKFLIHFSQNFSWKASWGIAEKTFFLKLSYW